MPQNAEVQNSEVQNLEARNSRFKDPAVNQDGAPPVKRVEAQPQVAGHAPEGISETLSRPRSVRRQTPFRIAAAALVLLLIVGGILVWRHYAGWESTDDAEIDAHIHPISARIAGHVARVAVDDNQEVKAGDLLAEIDPADYAVAVQRAEAELADAQANAEAARQAQSITAANTSSQLTSAALEVANNRAALRGTQQQFQAAQARVREAEANNAKAQADLQRYRQLVEKDEISRQQYDQAVATAQASAATVDVQRAAVAVAQQQITQSQGRISEAQAGVRTAETAPQQVAATRARAVAGEAEAQKAKATLDQARLNVQYTRILSPVNGIVGRKSSESGQNVQTGQELMSIVSLDDVWVTANFKETQLKKMHPGEDVQIYCDSNGRTYQGKVESLGAASGARFSLLPPENATGNYVKVVQRLPVKIVLNPGENSDHTLRPGMSVEARVKVK